MNDTVSCVRYVDTGPHPHPSSCVASNICSHGRDMDQASVQICSHGRDMLHCIMLQPCVQLEKSEHPHPNLDCLSSTYPGIKNPCGLSHGRAGPRARAGSAGPRGPHPYSPYPRGLRAGPRARTTGAPNPSLQSSQKSANAESRHHNQFHDNFTILYIVYRFPFDLTFFIAELSAKSKALRPPRTPAIYKDVCVSTFRSDQPCSFIPFANS